MKAEDRLVEMITIGIKGFLAHEFCIHTIDSASKEIAKTILKEFIPLSELPSKKKETSTLQIKYLLTKGHNNCLKIIEKLRGDK